MFFTKEMASPSIGGFEARLNSFPHSFHLVEMKSLNRKKRTNILKRLQSEEIIKKSEMERNRDDNFISFLLFLINDDDTEADELNRTILERDQTNMVAQANHVQILIKKGDIFDAESHLQLLESSKKNANFHRIHAEAEAEIAYCLSRMSPKFYFKAVEIFKSVNEKYPEEYLWKYGEGLTLRRCISPNCYSVYPQHDIAANIIRCSKLLREVTTRCKDKQLSARAWVELGELNNYLANEVTLIGKNVLIEVKKLVEVEDWVECFKTAFETSSNNHTVLQVCGKYFRYCYDYSLSQKLLEKAIDILPTAFSHHHLAITLKKIAENAVKRSSFEGGQRPWRGRGHGCQRYRNNVQNRNGGYHHSEPWNYKNHEQFRFPPAHGFSADSTPTTRYAPQFRHTNGRRGKPHNLFGNEGLRQPKDAEGPDKNVYSGKQRGHPRNGARGRRPNERQYQGSHHQDGHVHGDTYHGGQKQLLQDVSCRQDVQRADSTLTSADDEAGLDAEFAAMSLSKTFINQKHTGNNSQSRSNQNSSKRLQNYLSSQRPKVKLSKDDPLIVKAIYHLNASVKMTNECNMKAFLDLGHINVQMDDDETAEKYFKKVIQGSDENGSPLDMVIACEELGLCYVRMIKKSPEDECRLNEKVQYYLTLAIQKAADIVAKIPCLQMTGIENRRGFQTVSKLLQNQYNRSKEKNVLKDVARLHELVGKYKESLDFYKEILKTDRQEVENVEFWKTIINSYLQCDNFNNAVTLLKLLLCTPQARDVPRDLVHKVYIETARHSFEHFPPNRAHSYLQSVFRYKFGRTCEIKDDDFDIMILFDEKDDTLPDVADNTLNILKRYTGLGITKNLDDGFGAKMDITNYEEIMQAAEVIVVVLGPSPPSRSMQLWIGIATELHAHGNKTIVCVTTKEYERVLPLAKFKHLPAPESESATVDACLPAPESEHKDWVLQFFSVVLDS